MPTRLRPTPTQTRRRLGATDLALVAAFAALLAVLGLPGTIYLGGSAVPITLQTLGVMLTGAVLGWRRGVLTILLFMALVAIGMPLLAGGRGGLGVFAGPTVGYFLGWVPGVALIGAMIQARLPRVSPWWTALACALGGIVVIYAIGVPVLAARTNISLATAASGSLAFLPGDVIKVVIAVAVTRIVHIATPGLTAPLR